MIKDTREEFSMRNPEKPSISQRPSLENKGVSPFSAIQDKAVSGAPPIGIPQTKEPQIGKKLSKRAIAARVGIAAIIAAEAAGATHYEIANDKPFSFPQSVAEDVVTPPWELAQMAIDKILNRGSTVPSTFDSVKEKQVVGENNSKRITPQEAERRNILSPQIEFDKSSNLVKITSIFPLFLPDNLTSQILIDKTVQLRPGINPETSPLVAENFPSLPKGYGIALPKNTHYDVIKEPDGKVKLMSGFYYDEVNNLTVIWSYGTDRSFNSHVPTTDRENYRAADPSFNFEKLPISNSIIPLVSTTEDNQPVGISMVVVRGKYIPGTRDFIPAKNIQYNHQTEDQKLLVINANN